MAEVKMNLAWADVEGYLRKGEWEEAGITIGSIINEICAEDPEHNVNVDEIIDGIYGEVES